MIECVEFKKLRHVYLQLWKKRYQESCWNEENQPSGGHGLPIGDKACRRVVATEAKNVLCNLYIIEVTKHALVSSIVFQ